VVEVEEETTLSVLLEVVEVEEVTVKLEGQVLLVKVLEEEQAITILVFMLMVVEEEEQVP
jgi:hypothetical protein